jgi:hypothetical protein
MKDAMPTTYTPVPPVFLNMIVIVERRPVKDGNSNGGDFQVTCHPPYLVVTEPGSIINFQLIAPTPDTIKFSGIDKKKPNPERQLSDPSVSVDGRQMTLSDANTIKETIDVTLLFNDGDCSGSFDPQVQNDPKP